MGKKSLNLELYRLRYELLKLGQNPFFSRPSVDHSAAKGAPKRTVGKSKLGISNA